MISYLYMKADSRLKSPLLMQNNSYYHLDEPFNGLDLSIHLMLNEIISQLRSQQKVVILSSHIFGSLRENCDEILVLEHGAITQRVESSGFDLLEAELKEHLLGDWHFFRKNLIFIRWN
jgi:ABC-2 type transport system ATP-binding protein